MKKLLFTLSLALSCLAARACGDYATSDNFVVHEWGTFTSIQGTDGIPISWQSLNSGDLPDFVYNRTRANDAAALGIPNIISLAKGKGEMSMLQRMETPVIYFYASKPKSVDVTVTFPKGYLTEWYPQISKLGPVFGTNQSVFVDAERNNQSYLSWHKVGIIPGSSSSYPKESRPSHYYAARETDAASISLQPPSNLPPTASGDNILKPQYEKFLFYRGLGNFASPLMARANTDESVMLQNNLAMPLQHIFIIDQRANSYSYQYLPTLDGQKTSTISLKYKASPSSSARNKSALLADMQKALISAGLYEKEAMAMVKTWEDSWFDESGVRVLYVLPSNWVDQTLPLTITPTPHQTARVFVGRAELFTPALEEKLRTLVTNYSSAEAPEKASFIQAVGKLQLGRFKQAAFQRIASQSTDQKYNQAAWQLYQSSSQQPPFIEVQQSKESAAISLSCKQASAQ